MTPEQLDRPENRRRIETQAAAEQGNARRLSALTSVGEQLINEATKNDQFNVETLENWANMLNTLNEIAGNRMPSVADLLQTGRRCTGITRARQARRVPGVSAFSIPPKQDLRLESIEMVDRARAVARIPNRRKTCRSCQPSATSNPVRMSWRTFQNNKKHLSRRHAWACPAPSCREEVPTNPSRRPVRAQKKVDEAVEEQEDLLAEFAKVAEELQKILNNLEGSTFVKRLKAASRRQLEVAGELNGSLMKSFGFSPQDVDDSVKKKSDSIAKREVAQSDNVYVIQEDLEAYFNRVQQGKYKTVVDGMHETVAWLTSCMIWRIPSESTSTDNPSLRQNSGPMP